MEDDKTTLLIAAGAIGMIAVALWVARKKTTIAARKVMVAYRVA